MIVKTRGIVLAQTPLSSQDKKLTLLTFDYGMIEAVARNVTGGKSRLVAASEVLAFSDFCLYKGRSHYIVNSADLEKNFYNIRLDLTALALAGYFCELIRYILPDLDTAESCLRLLLNCLSLLETGKRSPRFLKAVFELRLLSLSGFAPDFSDCVRCGKKTGEDLLFLPIEGRLCCEKCLQETPYDKLKIPTPPSILAALRHIVRAEDKEIYSFRLTADGEKFLGAVTEAFALCHADGKFKALEFYKSLEDL